MATGRLRAARRAKRSDFPGFDNEIATGTQGGLSGGVTVSDWLAVVPGDTERDEDK
jgi:hypothetical protein